MLGMMNDKNKKIAALIVAGKPEEKELSEKEEAYKAAAEEIKAAFDSKDPMDLVGALKSFIQMCVSEGEEEKEGESESYEE